MAVRLFTEQEKKFIEDNCEAMTVFALKKAVGCSWEAMNHYLKSRNLTVKEHGSKSWEPDLVRLHQYTQLGYSDKKIARLLSRTETAVALEISRLGLKRVRKRNRRWTVEDIVLLKKLWGKYSLEYISRKMGRTINALKVKAQRLGLPPMLIGSEHISVTEFCEICNISRDRLTRWRKMGFPTYEFKATNKCVYMCIDATDALLWMEQHQDEFDASYIEVRGLIFEPEWLQQKRSRDIYCKGISREERRKGINTQIVDRRYWTLGELKRLRVYCEAGLSVETIAKELDKTVGAVWTRIRKEKINYVG